MAPKEISRALASLTDDECEQLLHDWRFLARESQVAPEGDWQNWLILAGRGFGKTRTGAEWAREQLKAGASRLGLIAPTASDARDVMVEGESGLLAVCWAGDKTHDGVPLGRPSYEPSKRRLTWANGAIATLFSAEEPERLRGPQHDRLWCFIAGTMVATPDGNVPIEALRPGDMVLTRRGPRPVVANSVRKSVVGRVTFGNGAFLVGTADHPVYLKSGWTRMDRLRIGDTACALAASNGMASAGIATARGAAPTTSAPTRQSGRSAISAFIARSGYSIMARCRMDTKSITETTTRRTTISTTLSVCERALIRACTGLSRLFRPAIGMPSQIGSSGASIAALPLFASGLGRIHDAPLAIGSTQTRSGKSLGHALNAAALSCRGTETIAVSVASTWQRMAEREVFCLKVAGEPEYFANGILVHNCDELAAWKYLRETWDMAMFGLRLGDNPRTCITTTPKPLPLVKEIAKDERTVITKGSTFDNASNLAPTFLKAIRDKYEGTRLGRQELNAEILDDLPGALWQRGAIDKGRVRQCPDLQRIVVAVDPSGTKGESDDGDEIGIVVAGKGVDGRGYILADQTCKLSPDGWGRRAVDAYHGRWSQTPDRFKADRIVAERNFGGAMVEHVIRTIDRTASYKEVTASRGKVARAEPVAALYEQGRVSHVGSFPELEDQMCSIAPEGYVGEGSPDRADALVWALTELMITGSAYTLAHVS